MCNGKGNPYKPLQAEIIEVKEETYDTKSYKMRFTDPKVQSEFSFVPGQFNMLTVYSVGEAAISISSSPSEKEYFTHTIREVGDVTKTLPKLKVGDKVGIRGPYGRGWPVKEMENKNVLMVGGGIGMAPLRPLLYYIAENREKFGDFENLYGARTPDDALYTDEFEKWQLIPRTATRFSIRNPYVSGIFLDKQPTPRTKLRFTVDSVPRGVKWKYDQGRVTTLFAKMNSRAKNTIVVSCGPEIMLRFVVQGLLEREFTSEQIYVSLERRMNCGIGKCGFCQIGSKFVCKDGPVFSYNEIANLTEKIF